MIFFEDNLLFLTIGTTENESRYLLDHLVPKDADKVSDLQRKTVQVFSRTFLESIFNRRQQVG